MRNTSFLGCLNNRHQQMRKMAKATALRLAEKFKEEKEKEKSKEEKNKDNKNTRNRSTNFPSNQIAKPVVPVATSNTAIMNKSGNSIRKPVSVGAVKLPKVSTIVSNNMSNTSVKAIGEISMKREGAIMPGSKE